MTDSHPFYLVSDDGEWRGYRCSICGRHVYRRIDPLPGERQTIVEYIGDQTANHVVVSLGRLPLEIG